MNTIPIGSLAANSDGAFKIGPFGSSLTKRELALSGVPVVGIENILPNAYVRSYRRFISNDKYQALSDYAITPGDVLVTTMGTIGRAAVAPIGVGKAIIDSHLFRMRVDSSRVIPEYLCYAINSIVVVQQLARLARGSIMDGLNTSILRACTIPLPDVRKQQRVIKVLALADRLRQMRRATLDICDEVLPSAFVEIFGDPITNSHRYPIAPLEELVDPGRPISYGILMPGPDIPGGVPYVRVTDIKDGLIDWRHIRRTTAEVDAAYKRSRLAPGDVLMSIRGQVGRLTIVPEVLRGGNITQDTARLAPIPRIDARYLVGCLSSGPMQRLMASLTRGAAVQGINLGDVKELPIPVPPESIQKKFAILSRTQQHLRAMHVEAVRQAEHLFQTLLHRAFTEGL